MRLNSLNIDRDQFIGEMRTEGVSCSVHWRPLHLHPYYEQTFGWRPEDLPVASSEWKRLVSLPIFSAMKSEEIDAVVNAVKQVCSRASRRRLASAV
jgi:perosamine synthetase